MTALPPSTDFAGSSVTQGQFKTAISALRTFVAELLGTDSGDKAAARAALGAAAAGANSDITSLAAPALGAATATTQAGTDSSTKVATTAQVVAAMQASPGVIVTGAAIGIGYGVGAGATAIQATSKTTAVTLNRTCGQITMSSASLAANTTVMFTLNNSLIAATDQVVLSLYGFGFLQSNYQFWASSRSGEAVIMVRNMTAGALSDALVINFAIIKGVTS